MSHNQSTEPQYDDGLVHDHRWATEPGGAQFRNAPCVANPEFLSVPSTIYQDEHVFPADDRRRA